MNNILNDNFEILKLLGEGSYAKVYLIKNKTSNKLFAIKVIKKSSLKTNEEEDLLIMEKNILSKNENPFIINFYCSFQTTSNLYFLLEYCEGGELYSYISGKDRLNYEAIKQISAQVLLGLLCLHNNKYVYRDLKPENIIIDNNGYIRLIDFGLSTTVSQAKNSNQQYGTAQYFPPEIVLKKGHCYKVDSWSFGCLLYEMISGKLPFKYNKCKDILFKTILNKSPKFNKLFTDDAKDLITKCLNKNKNQRISAQNIQNHPFFDNIIWEDIKNKNFTPIILTKKEKDQVNNISNLAVTIEDCNKEDNKFIDDFNYNDNINFSKF